MRPSEKLILMLDLNDYNVDNLLLKKKIDCDESGNIDIHNHDRYSDVIISNYLFEDDLDYTNRNPLSYKAGTWDNVDSLDQLVVKHPEVGKKLAIKDFLSIEIFSNDEKKNILNGVIHTWIDEYKEARTKSMKNLHELFFSITGDTNKNKKPSKILFAILFLFAVFNAVLFIRPEFIQPGFIPFISDFMESWSTLLSETPVYYVFGAFTTLLFVLYAIQNYALSTRIRGVMREKDSKVIKKLYKWDIYMQNAISKQSKRLTKYVNLVVKKPEKSELKLKKFTESEELLDKYIHYVKRVEKKYDWMNNHYSTRMKYIRITYISFLLLDLAFIGIAFAIIRGLINV